MSKTLYVTDLDGTLLQNGHTLSNNTIALINKLLDQGLYFTYATSRSIHTAAPITQSLHITLPVITRDGCVIANTQNRIEIEVKKIPFQKIITLLPIFSPIIHSGFMTSYTQGRESKLYLRGTHSQGFQNYLNEHHYDADASYAMKNAIDELKHIATDILGDNDSDSVARWLINNYKSFTRVACNILIKHKYSFFILTFIT